MWRIALKMLMGDTAKFCGILLGLTALTRNEAAWLAVVWVLIAWFAGGTTIRCAKYATFGTQALSDNALVALEGRLACLLGQHGQISLGKNLESSPTRRRTRAEKDRDRRL